MLNFVTTNAGKVREAEQHLPGPVEQLAYDYEEIQAPDLGTIAAHGAREAYRAVGEPVIVDDSGIFIAAFDGFPGPYSAYVDERVGIERVWRLTEPEQERAATFRTVLAYCDGAEFAATPEPVDLGAPEQREGTPNGERERPKGATRERRGQDQAADDRAAATTDAQVRGQSEGPPVKLFEGVVHGEIVAPRGDGGFGYDPIFEHGERTFAERSTAEKNAVSHRGRALARFAEWYAQR